MAHSGSVRILEPGEAFMAYALDVLLLWFGLDAVPVAVLRPRCLDSHGARYRIKWIYVVVQ